MYIIIFKIRKAIKNQQILFYYLEVVNEQVFPLKLEIVVEKGDMEVYVGQKEKPSWSNFDYAYTVFGKEITNSINYNIKQI